MPESLRIHAAKSPVPSIVTGELRWLLRRFLKEGPFENESIGEPARVASLLQVKLWANVPERPENMRFQRPCIV